MMNLLTHKLLSFTTCGLLCVGVVGCWADRPEPETAGPIFIVKAQFHGPTYEPEQRKIRVVEVPYAECGSDLQIPELSVSNDLTATSCMTVVLGNECLLTAHAEWSVGNDTERDYAQVPWPVLNEHGQKNGATRVVAIVRKNNNHADIWAECSILRKRP